jgi:uncharacterized membrane protein YeaQ/YmgE (transglycosylase-associated protein family)
MDNLFFLAWLIGIAVLVGGSIGMLTGWLTKRLLREPWQSASGALLDGAIGSAGLVFGALISVTSRSFLYEEWYDGKLVTRRTDGFADHIYLFAIVGAIALVFIARLSISLARKLICKTSINADERMDAKA